MHLGHFFIAEIQHLMSLNKNVKFECVIKKKILAKPSLLVMSNQQQSVPQSNMPPAKCMKPQPEPTATIAVGL